MRKQYVAIAGLALIGALALSGCSDVRAPSAAENSAGAESEATSQPEETSTAEASESVVAAESTYADLQYLIEEEKLAHDVYTALYEAWGSKVFGNILESETTHQNRVAELLVAFDVEDPRAAEPGVFIDPELQDLYHQLVAKGQTSQQDAIEVGILIEEKDIADIQVQLDTVTDSEIVQVLESLLKGSENHLAAFTKQLN